ncbi:HIT-like protein [Gigaspora margarita]|uniref:HIT-like protein n=1 Tax=Gigaspora margarita TaxID=4874 RepID=A0A8H3X572_GIGMA|nr:HIT-like protein [Gigaspora margarita]
MSSPVYVANCIFCRIAHRKAPSTSVYETKYSYAFLDISPLSEGHTLVVPKTHAEFLHELSDEYLADLLPVAKKIAVGTKAEHYNILQNNGKEAHQAVGHVHIHVIPKPNQEEGLGIKWPAKEVSPDQLAPIAQRIIEEIEKNSEGSSEKI